jgi:sugar O-acyltransferase (sialic acid O-acetyltransferase NeuD family)
MDCMQASGMPLPCAILDADRSLWGEKIFGVEISGGDELLAGATARGVSHFIVGLGSTGDCKPRRRLFEAAVHAGLKPLTVIHPSAIISRWCEIGDGAQILPGCIVNARARIGINTIVNSGAIVEHDCFIGNHVHIATGAKLASTVRVGDTAHIGAGASIRQGVLVGEEAVIGMGAVVITDVLPRTVVTGIPARTRRGNETVLMKRGTHLPKG